MMGPGGAEGGGLPLGRVVVAIIEVSFSSEMLLLQLSPACLAACDIYDFSSKCPKVKMYTCVYGI